MPLYSRLPRRVAIGLEALMPVMIGVLVAAVILLALAIDTQSKTEHRHAQVVACASVDRSNAATLAWLRSLIVTGPRVNDPSALATVTGLASAYHAVSVQCLLGVQ
jgi:hypothetical protein